MAIIGQTTLRKIRLSARLLKADELIGISQGRISIRARGYNALFIGRIHDCSRSFLSSTIPLKKALTQSAGPYMRLKNEISKGMKRRLIGSKLITNETCKKMSKSIDRTTMTVMDQGIKRLH